MQIKRDILVSGIYTACIPVNIDVHTCAIYLKYPYVALLKLKKKKKKNNIHVSSSHALYCTAVAVC